MWIFATRNRVENCKRFIKLWHELEASSPVYLRLDEDDPALEEMKSLPWPKEFIMNIGPRVRLGGSMQEMFHNYPNEPFYGLLAAILSNMNLNKVSEHFPKLSPSGLFSCPLSSRIIQYNKTH